MEEYPEEIRSPPVSLVSVVGCPELHQTISMHLHSQQPPINTLALPDLSKISLLIASKPKDEPSSPPDSPSACGILKRDWLLKHRTKIPAVVAALFSSDCVSGDPAQWLQLCSDLDNLKYSNKLCTFAIVSCLIGLQILKFFHLVQNFDSNFWIFSLELFGNLCF